MLPPFRCVWRVLSSNARAPCRAAACLGRQGGRPSTPHKLVHRPCHAHPQCAADECAACPGNAAVCKRCLPGSTLSGGRCVGVSPSSVWSAMGGCRGLHAVRLQHRRRGLGPKAHPLGCNSGWPARCLPERAAGPARAPGMQCAAGCGYGTGGTCNVRGQCTKCDAYFGFVGGGCKAVSAPGRAAQRTRFSVTCSERLRGDPGAGMLHGLADLVRGALGALLWAAPSASATASPADAVSARWLACSRLPAVDAVPPLPSSPYLLPAPHAAGCSAMTPMTCVQPATATPSAAHAASRAWAWRSVTAGPASRCACRRAARRCPPPPIRQPPHCASLISAARGLHGVADAERLDSARHAGVLP